MGGAVFPPRSLNWDQTVVEAMKIMATSFNRLRARPGTLSAPSPAAATPDPCLCRRMLDTPGQVRVSLWWGHCSLLLGQVVLVVKNLPANAGDTRGIGLIPGSRRSPGAGSGIPLQYTCLEIHQRSLMGYSPWGHRDNWPWMHVPGPLYSYGLSC